MSVHGRRRRYDRGAANPAMDIGSVGIEFAVINSDNYSTGGEGGSGMKNLRWTSLMNQERFLEEGWRIFSI